MTDRTADGVKSAVAIMAKAPQPGQVKTRLCPPLSHREAAQLYQCFLLDKIAQVNGIQGGGPSALIQSRRVQADVQRLDATPFYADSATWG
jgi:uncharacterized protein